ncbi:DUF1223 domain-containing protein [Albidovulum sediminicola]|uniref:DUF1223 domain-containing protein n=1 Tax=Albidovulum sediminicola TaxID=2984331 RepID=A0ABT2Z2M6_9RHOB|nr:DUF1223 domain-containing protein [Defluviimonas sp. WL0075]MCV2865353.1 DUF1223 domain-containing protein [Defluviimonas sp. WL0075]
MRLLLSIAFCLLSGLCLPSSSGAGESPVVIELYTSQGCSSCPPADALLQSMAGRSDVLPLALHVDYWDYIGWKDTFGQAKFADRQRAYARKAGVRMIYTPQMIVGGMDHVVGVRAGALDKAVRRLSGIPDPVSLQLERSGDAVSVTARAQATVPQDMVVQLVRVRPTATVAIDRGENAGRSITYSHIVTDWTAVGKWDGREPFHRRLKIAGPEEVVVIVQATGPGRILAAAVLR